MYKEKVYSLMLTLLCLLISSAGRAQNAAPTLTSDDEVCVFLLSPDNSTYYFTGTKNGTAYQPSAITSSGTTSDGLYLYKWTVPSDEVQLDHFSIQDGDATGAKLYDGVYTNHGIYFKYTKTSSTDVISDAKVLKADDSYTLVDDQGTETKVNYITDANAKKVFFESPVDGSFNIWPYWAGPKGDGTDDIGGQFYTGSPDETQGNWPGDKLVKLGKLNNGHFLYSWTFTNPHNQEKDPTAVIFSVNGGASQFLPKTLTFNYLYTEIKSTGTQTPVIQQLGIASTVSNNTFTTLDPHATLNSTTEISMFIESSDENGANYYVWPWSTNHPDPKDVDNPAGFYTGSPFNSMKPLEKVATLDNGHYLYKWTYNPALHPELRDVDLPTNLEIAKDNRDTKILNNGQFTNHGYYVDNGNGTVTFKDEVVRLANGTLITGSRTAFGKRVIYEMNIGSFYGNFNNAKPHLNYLKNLGVDVIWLMPIWERGASNSPYAVKNYYHINDKYGTTEDLKSFVSAAHDLGMDVWLDFVVNHTDTANVWADPKSGDDFHPEYYVGYNSENRTDTTGFVHPTYIDAADGNKEKPYPDVYQLNFDYQVTKDGESYVPAARALREVMTYWINQTDIDGFRFDMASSKKIPTVFWNTLTSRLKAIKPSLQFLAEADFSRDKLPQSDFQYDYAWDFNDRLRGFGQSVITWQEVDNTNNPASLSYITKRFLDQTNGYKEQEAIHSSRMIYLINHDVNNTAGNTLTGIWGENRFPMTVYQFTMPGMPLIYNGQDVKGTEQLSYFNDTPIDWSDRDYVMTGLLQQLAYLKHNNNALRDGNTSDLRGKTVILNSYEHNVLAYERINGDQHVLVVLNLSDGARNADILGASKGTWKRVLYGNNENVNVANDNYDISDKWTLTNIPAHGYEIFTYTGESNTVPKGYYLVTNDNNGVNDDITKHPFTKIPDDGDYYRYRISLSAAEFNTITKNGTSLPFKIQEYYDFMDNGATCKNDNQFGAKDDKSTFTATNSEFASAATPNNYDFNIEKGADNIVKYNITFYRGISNSDECKVKVEFVNNSEVADGFYLITPANVSTDNDTHKWRFNYSYEDPASVSDNWLTKINTDEKYDLASFVIDANQFETYIPADRRAAQTIQFRIRETKDGQDTKDNDKSHSDRYGKITDICPDPNPSPNSDHKNSTFDASKDSNDTYYDGAHWDPIGTTDNYFNIVEQPDVSKYIIQVWRTRPAGNSQGTTRVRVYYIRRFNYPGSSLEDVVSTNEDVYLYNVDAQKFLYTGNDWGTEASLLYDDLGTRLNLFPGKTDDNPNFIAIRTKFENNTTVPGGHFLGIDDKSYSATATYNDGTIDDFDRLNRGGLFLDRDNGDRWIFEKIGDDDNVNTYLLRLYNDNDGRYHYMVANHGYADPNENTKVFYIAQQDVTVKASDLKDDDLQNGAERGTDVDVQYIHNLGTNGGFISYKYTAPKTGTYRIRVHYMTDQDKQLTVTNVTEGNSQTLDAASTGSQTNTTAGQYLDFSLHMKAGENEITFGQQANACPRVIDYTISMTRPDDLSYARWQIVTYKDLVAKLKNENAEVYGGTSADATFLMKDQGFTRYVNNTWDTDNNTAENFDYITGYTDGQPIKVNANFTSTVTCDKTKIGDRKDFGMYWNGRVKGQGLVYQDVEVPVSGVYQYDAYGFYHGTETRMFCQYASEMGSDGKVTKWSDMDASTVLYNSPRAYDVTNQDADKFSGEFTNFLKYNDQWAGQQFYDESVLGDEPKYKNTMFLYVPQQAPKDGNGNYKIRIGFFKTANETDDKDWTAVDDVHLHYCGKSPFVLDDSWSSKQLINQIGPKRTEKRPNVQVWLKRKFYADQWNTLVLPVSVSTQQLRSIFGANVQVATPYGIDDEHPTYLRFTPVRLTNGSIAIEAGKYYIVNPEKLNGSDKVIYVHNDNSVEQISIPASDNVTRYYNLGIHDLSQDLPTTIDPLAVGSYHQFSKGDKGDKYDGIDFIGSYHALNGQDGNGEVPENSYVFTNRKELKLITAPAPMNGFRFYMRDAKRPTGVTSKSFIFGSLDEDRDKILDSFNERDSEPTGIDEVNSSTGSNNNGGSAVNDGDVYDVSGRRVAVDGQTDALPSGVYIINGHKFVKK